MGMYDYLNGEQIKVFFTAGIGLPDSFTNHCVFFSGGHLNVIEEDVPYRSFVYNYGKDFNIIDFFPFDDERGFVHIIRDGKNLGKRYFDELTEEDLNFESYNDHGYRLNIKSVDDIYGFIDAQNAFMEAYKKISRKASKAWGDYAREHKGDVDFDEKYKELYFLTKVEDEQNDKMLAPFLQEKNKYFLEDLIPEKYSIFGGLLEGLSNPMIEDYMSPDHKFVVGDDRLTFIVAYNEMKKMAEDKSFVEKYFKLMGFDEEEKQEILDFIEELDEVYDKMRSCVFFREQFNETYALKDIYEGRYKKYYLEYDILPFAGFEHTLWDNCKADISNENYSKFEKDLEEYVAKRFREMNEVNR